MKKKQKFKTQGEDSTVDAKINTGKITQEKQNEQATKGEGKAISEEIK